ncbi:unnamed protein product [Enterobius vermicularis]|uniref:Uncharacterized protein n=1 Tax=Enterobius vermicularis TaxID=51028 RepID=A0A0N4VPX2_ENTVE|nr:unnamed protein product [Enterobius vermicularis]
MKINVRNKEEGEEEDDDDEEEGKFKVQLLEELHNNKEIDEDYGDVKV